MTRLRTAVVGVGHLGKEHARILANMREVDLVGVADSNFEQAQAVAERVGTKAHGDFHEFFGHIDAACIVVPTFLHEKVASEFLSRGISVLVEKPLAPEVKAANRLVELADKNEATLQVGHIERFNPAFEEMMRRPMQAKYIRAERVGPFTGRSSDVGVVLDLMIHDLDLVLTLAASRPTSIEALGISVFGRHEDIANARLKFANGCVAEILANRSHPTAHRTMQVWGPEGYAGLDFAARRVTLVQQSDAVRSHGLDPAALDPKTRGNIKEELFTRHLEMVTVDGQAQDQLTAELRDFVTSVSTGRAPRVPGTAGRDALALAEEILEMIQAHAWSEKKYGPHGPCQLPPPKGLLIPRVARQTAA